MSALISINVSLSHFLSATVKQNISNYLPFPGSVLLLLPTPPTDSCSFGHATPRLLHIDQPPFVSAADERMFSGTHLSRSTIPSLPSRPSPRLSHIDQPLFVGAAAGRTDIQHHTPLTFHHPVPPITPIPSMLCNDYLTPPHSHTPPRPPKL
jgi:hypothetical protein